MRSSSEVVKKLVSVEQSINIASERIIQINEDKISMQIVATYGLYDVQDMLIEQRSCVIQGEHYVLIMAKSPDFAPGKPANEYRESDLWYVIDLIMTSMAGI